MTKDLLDGFTQEEIKEIYFIIEAIEKSDLKDRKIMLTAIEIYNKKP